MQLTPAMYYQMPLIDVQEALRTVAEYLEMERKEINKVKSKIKA